MEGRLKILDLWVDPVDMNESLSVVKSSVEKGKKLHSIFAVNPEKIFSVPKDPGLYETFKNADLLIPDGIGIVLAARLLHGRKLCRVPGVELMLNICWLAALNNYRVYIFGAKEEVNMHAVRTLVDSFPGLHVCGRQNGYLREDDMLGLVADINRSKAQILFLALGSPRQEKWFSKYGHLLEHVRVCQGIGGTLDVISGNVRRAPAVWSRNGLEWLYRLLSEPQRLKRQSVLPLFAARVVLSKLT